MKTKLQSLANQLASVPMEHWHSRGIPLAACSANADGIVNSFITHSHGGKWHGWRKHEFRDGMFTGVETFEIEAIR